MKSSLGCKAILLILAWSMVMLLSACSGSGADTASNNDAGSAKGPKTGDGSALIKFVAAEYSTATKPFLEQLVKDFEAENPDIKVELQVINWDTLESAYNTMISTNNPPDLLNTYSYAHFARDELLNDLGEIMSPELKEKFYPSFMEVGRLDGTQYALPFLASVRGLYYNKDILDEAGVTEVPKTWSELKAAAQKIKDHGKASGFGIDMTNNEGQAYLSYFFWGAGGGWQKDGEWTLNSPENVEALTFLKEMVDEGLSAPEPTVTSRDEQQRILGNGKLGMMITANFFSTVVPNEFPGLKWGVGPTPVKDGQPPSTLGVQDLLMSFQTKHTNKEAISKFLDFFYEDTRYEEFMVKEGFLPATQTVGDKMSAEDEVMKAHFEAIKVAKFYPVNDPAWPAVLDASKKMGQAVILGQMSPKEALDQLQEIALKNSK
ncbi:extracellular solute-binding protein [Paenibacillus sp. J2TS4]|uniref:extracellular solute-binding protein n=1 Tax=Paenibacillus sp. J2TS4 TaxID=2807194 RepID=UPI001BCD397E|nr:extracellular solute-binding protein [Paenibacillus sp. J2TS4]